MKLIPLIILTMSTVIDVESNEHYTFPPQFRRPDSGGVSSDSSHYLPPDSHTSIPYLPMRNFNNLPYPYLPAATKAPMMFPSPFPMILSSTLVPIDDDDEESENENPQPSFQRNNRTERNRPQNFQVQNRDLRSKPTYHPIDRIDMKNSAGFGPYPNPVQTATSRSFIISAEPPKNDMDQIKAAATAGPQYLPAPGLQNVFISSTTEPAVPIIRLSNEMDLDGSFSYEALGADQTHYVQHSHVENQGTDKEEQVVEGSYSYVGDNGQTYTVHYIADANGFRASGDHLPVAPPIPEIIQRAVQYNLAEESKKPPHLKSWQNNENEISESERIQFYANTSPRSLYTGKTPEAFSFSFAQGSPNNQNNMISAASTQNSVKANVDFTPEHMKTKTNGGPISPQITFAASQGAHVPSANPQQSMGRMPQLINYESGLKESQQESDKALWRWQYGMNANIQQQAPEKNSISRSFGEGDDVMINFSDMSPDQYTKMIKSQLEPNSGISQNSQNSQISNNVQNAYQQKPQNIQNQASPTTQQPIISTKPNYYPSQTENWFRSQSSDKQNQYYPNQNDYNFSNTDNYNTFIQSQSEPNSDMAQNRPKTQTSNHIKSSYDKESTNIQNQDSPITQQPISSTETNYYLSQTENWYKSLNNDHENQHYNYNNPDKYNSMVKSQSEPNSDKFQNSPRTQTSNHIKGSYEKESTNIQNQQSLTSQQTVLSTETNYYPSHTENWYKSLNTDQQNQNYRNQNEYNFKPDKSERSEYLANARSKLVTYKKFAPASQTVTQSYNYDDSNYNENNFYESERIRLSTVQPTQSTNNVNIQYYKKEKSAQNSISSKNQQVNTTTEASNHYQFSDFAAKENENNFRPSQNQNEYNLFTEQQKEVTTTEMNKEEILKDNIFLRNLLKINKNEHKENNKIVEDSKSLALPVKTEIKPAEHISRNQQKPKLISMKSKTYNEIQNNIKKPLNIADILNYISAKNHFESNKLRPKNNMDVNYDQRNDAHYIPVQHNRDQDNEEDMTQNARDLHSTYYQPEELRGIIKNYKVLQRNNSVLNTIQETELNRDLSPPPLIMLQSSNLPPLGRAGPSMKTYLPPIYV